MGSCAGFSMGLSIGPCMNPCVGLGIGLGMGLGMTLILFALSGGEVGIIATLSATTPVLMLPMMWWRTGEAPALGAWVGAAGVVAGSALLFAS